MTQECDLRSYCRCFSADDRLGCENLIDARECWWTPEAQEHRMKRVVEIRSAEGGADSQVFVGELARAYEKLALRLG